MKKAKNSYIALILSCLFITSIFAQQSQEFIEVKGIVLNEDNQKIEQATISLSGTNSSTVTNKEGKFSLKVPTPISNQQFIVQAIGYTQQLVTLSKKNNKSLKIVLKTNAINLDTTSIVAYKNAQELVKRVFKNRNKNYSGDNTLMTAFYRETIKKGAKNASLAEAIVNIYKQPYSNNRKDQIKILKSRKDTDYSRLDTIALKLQGGPFSTLFIDVMKYPEYIFTQKNLDTYTFKYDNLTEINGENVYVVDFKHPTNSLSPSYQGKLYIEASSLALVKATCSLNLDNTNETTKLFVKRKPANVNVKPRNISYEVHYRQKNGTWIYGYSKADLAFDVRKQRKLFKSTYTLSCEMAITDWETTTTKVSKKSDNIINKYIIMADQNIGFGDAGFWGKYNVIEPEKSIQNAIKKIKRKLDTK